jgi:hypothetical protein
VEYSLDPNTFELVPSEPGYDLATHSYVWPLDDIDPNMSNCVQLTVVVNDQAIPGGVLHNVAELWGTVWVPDPNDPNVLYPETVLAARATLDTDVCCYAGTVEILYVDQSATNGNNTGLDWQNAFLELRDALNYARSSLCAQVHSIYVAQGPYSPGEDESDTFVLPDNVRMYGGFKVGGSTFEQRDPKRYVTTLTGRISDTERNDTVVKMGDETVLDGFTVSGASQEGYGIYGSGADFAINNCNIVSNENYGLYAEDGNVMLTWCTFRNNKADGIRHTGEGFTLTVENCWVRQSGQYGVNCINSTPTLRNSIISESDMANEGREGIFMANPTYPPVLLNCTLAHNRSAAVFFTDVQNVFGDPNFPDYPEIQNSIIYHNNNGGLQLAGFSADRAAWYSCIQDCNSVNFNISVEPQLAYFDPNNVRISYASPCRDAGSPLLAYEDQVDMDGRDRVLGNYADMGAYEIDCEDVSNELWDNNADGIVNMVEFNRWARVWLAHDPDDPAILNPGHPDYEYLTDPNSPGYVTPESRAAWYPDGYTFNYVAAGTSQYSIDLTDLLYWLEEAPWLWVACWKTEAMQLEMMMAGGSEMLRMVGFEPLLLETQAVPQKTVLEQMAELANAIVQLENLWLTEPDIRQAIEPDSWDSIMEAVYQNLYELATEVADKK